MSYTYAVRASLSDGWNFTMLSSTSLKIGSLLLQAELVKESDLNDSLPVAKKMKLPLGRVLVGTGFITDDMLNAALSAQSLIRDNMVSSDIAIKALKEVDRRGLTFAEALRQHGLNAEQLDFTNKLGQLLVDSDLITSTQRNESLQTALASGLPIGRVLVFKRAISNREAYAALSAQVLIRAKKISRDQAISALKLCKQNGCHLEDALRDTVYANSTGTSRIMLGELFVISNQISEVEFLTALENSLGNDRPLGQVLVELNLISKEMLERALTAQAKLASGELNVADLVDYIQNAELADLQSTASAETGAEPVFGLLELLSYSNLLTSTQANRVRKDSRDSSLSEPQLLIYYELISAEVLKVAKHCLAFYETNVITSEEAVLALYSWYSNPNQPVDDIICTIAQRDLN
ncbi:MAG TPA: hypothetical protein V6C97_05305 [Oculatellaceae cyanobacterium]